MTQTAQTSSFDLLRDQQYMNLITFRKSGEAIATPVWFVQDGARLYVVTAANAGKVKRVRNNARVDVGPSDRAGKPLGATMPARAHELPAAEHSRADALLTQKYGLQKRAIDLLQRVRGTQRTYLEIVRA